MSNILTKLFQNQKIEFDFISEDKLYLNATETARIFKKDVREWKRAKQTTQYIEALSDVGNFHISELVITKKGNFTQEKQGTWIHKKLIIAFARWLSPEFAVWCDLQIEEILKSKNSNSQSPQTKENDPITKRTQLIENAGKQFKVFKEVFEDIGITDKTELAITTNRAVKNETEIDFIALSGKNGLEVEEKFFTVTELCELIRESENFSDEIKLSVSTKNNLKPQPINLNKILESHGFQIKIDKQWKPTKTGENFSKVVQNKSMSSTKNIFHLNWKLEVLDKLF